MQIYADVTGKPMTITTETEASVLGSAIVVAVGAGFYADLPTASVAMVTISHEYQPDAERSATYQYYLKKYQETYQQLRPLMRDMADEQPQA